MPSLIDAVKRPFSDVWKSGVFFILSLPPISFVSFPWVYGYVFEVMRHVIDARPGLPDWVGFWSLAKDGLLFIVFAAASVLPGYLLLVLSSPGVLAFEDPAFRTLSSALAYLLLGLGSIAFPASMLKVARERSWSLAFHPVDDVRWAFSLDFIIAWVVSLAVSVAATILSLTAVAIFSESWTGLILSSLFIGLVSVFASLFTATVLAQSVARPAKKSVR